MAEKVFGISKPIIGMVHLQDRITLERLTRATIADIEAYRKGGIDGFLFENWGLTRYDILLQVSSVMKKVSALTDGAIRGVNILPFSWRDSLDIALETGADFIQIDTLVDRLQGVSERDEVHASEVMAYRRKLGLEGRVKVAVNIQSKHYTTMPQNKPLETSVKQARIAKADILVVTGTATGEKTPVERLLRVKKAAGKVPVFIGSGFVVEDADELLPAADGVIVGTGIKVGGDTNAPVDAKEVGRMMDIVKTFRR
jgi:hypothetical protein